MKVWLGALSYAMMWVMAKTFIGGLAATDHCRHAVTEMEALDNAWTELRKQVPDFSMSNWDTLDYNSFTISINRSREYAPG